MAAQIKQHCCSATLTVVGDDLDPEVVTAALGWAADKSWRRGDHKSFTRSDGTERAFDSLYDRGGYKCFAVFDERELSLQQQIAAWIERLQTKASPLKALRDRGWEIELNCFAASSEHLDLNVHLLAELAGLGVNLTVSFSADGNASHSEPSMPSTGT
jgi:hypothetical protein